MGRIRQLLFVLAIFPFLPFCPAFADIFADSALVVNNTTNVYPSESNPFPASGSKQALPIKSLPGSEIILKRNLNRLSFMGHGRYLDNYSSLAQMFQDINMYPEESKNKIFLLAVGGGIAGEALKYSRRELSKRNMGFIFPNLSGLNMLYRLAKIRGNLLLRFSNTDRIAILSAFNGRISAILHENNYAKQKNLAFQPLSGCQIFYLNTSYPNRCYHELGVAAYYKKIHLNFNFIKNFTFPERTRLSVTSFITI